MKNLDVQLMATISDNRIKSFDEFIDNWSTGQQEVVPHKNSYLAFSPSVLSSLSLQYKIFANAKWEVAVDLDNRYVGKQYVDNTSNPASELQAYWISDLGINFHFYTKTIRDLSLGLKFNNVFNEEYESNGWIYRFRSPDYNPVPDDPYAGSEGGSLYHEKGYFPQAGRNVMVQLNFNF